jgi:hypothetical protein
VAFQAFGVVNTFQAVLPSPDLKLLLSQLELLTEFQLLSGTVKSEGRKECEKEE